MKLNEKSKYFERSKDHNLSKLINYLISDNKNDVNEQDENGDTMLISAVKMKDGLLVDTILKYSFKLNINTTNYDGKNALNYSEDNSISKMLIWNGAKISYSDLFRAIENNHIDIIEEAIKQNIDINWQDDNGHSAIFHYIKNEGRNDYKILQSLIEAGADVNLTDALFNTCIFFTNNCEVIEYLIDNGAEINIQNDEGDYPIHKAVRNRNYEIIKLFIEKGALVNVKNYEGETLLDSLKGNMYYGQDPNDNEKKIFFLLMDNDIEYCRDFFYEPYFNKLEKAWWHREK